MSNHRFVQAAAAVVLVASTQLILAAIGFAQCETTWDVTLGNPGINRGYIQPMVAWNDGSGEKLYVGGSAEDIGGSGLNDFLAQYDPVTQQWSRLGTGINQGSTNAFLTKILPWDDGSGNGERLYVVGQFATAGGMSEANSFAIWDGSSWSGAGAGFSQSVPRVTYDMLPADIGDGERLYLAGNWSQIGSASVSGLAWYDGKAFGVWGTGDGIEPWGGFSPFVAALEIWDDGSGPAIYACGRFRGIDNASARDVARYNVGTGQWESIPAQIFPTGDLNNMTSWAIFDDGNGEALYLGGQGFRVSGDPNVYLVAKWDGSQWTGVGQTLSGRVTDLAVWDDGSGPALYLSGTATFEVNYFAKLSDGVWEPAQSGVNNPPVNGNFSSAFGLYQWNSLLLVGGNFSQVGGLDPVTGVGQGTPIPARGIAALQPCGGTSLTEFFVVIGDLLNGDLDSLRSSDNDYVHVESGFGETFVDRHNSEIQVSAQTNVANPATIDLTIESRIDEPAGIAQIKLLNHATQQFDLVGQYSVGTTDAVETVSDIDAANYVDNFGNITLSIKHIVASPFFAFSFETWIDWVEITVN